MNSSQHRKTIAAFFVVLVLAGLATTSLAASVAPPSPWRVESMEGGPPVTLLAEDRDVFHYVSPPKRSAVMGAQSATINVNYLANVTNYYGYYCDPWDPSARAAFQYAVDIWETLITSAVPIEINACWTDELPSIALGSAGAHSLLLHAPTNTWYQVALANAIAGSDQFPGTVDIEAQFNRTFAWYYGTDGNTPSGQYDFVSVVVHEICHGLGFGGSMRVSGGQGSWGLGSPPAPYIYDRFAVNGSGKSLLNTNLFPNPSAALAAQLQGDAVYFNGLNATAANGVGPPKLYAPTTWKTGSSYSHLDEIYNGTADALMTYSLGTAEAVHRPGPVTLGMMRDLGWVTADVWPDLSIAKEVVGDRTPAPGDPVTFTLTIANVGTGKAASVVVSDTLPSDIQSPSWDTTLPGVSVIGGTYLWQLPDMDVGATGVITVYGTINPGLPSDYTLWNTAETDTATYEAVGDNNWSIVQVGGEHLMIPLLLGDY
jgi:uncharacterized repeat protein (TIGR01451 family)